MVGFVETTIRTWVHQGQTARTSACHWHARKKFGSLAILFAFIPWKVTNGRNYDRTYGLSIRGDILNLTMPDGAYEQ